MPTIGLYLYSYPSLCFQHLEVAILKKSDSYLHCIRILLAKGANPCGVNGVGTPFLLIASEAGCTGVVNLLLQAGCSANQTREDGATGIGMLSSHHPCISFLAHLKDELLV